MKRSLKTLGIISIAVGLLWTGQGTGLFPYPKQSFMISQIPWAYYGGALAIIGMGMIFMSKKFG